MFVDIIDDIRFSAKKIVSTWENRFAEDELINEAWIRGCNVNRPTKHQVKRRAIWDMKDYVRREVGREGLKKKRPLFLTNVDSEQAEDERKISILDKEFIDENLIRFENEEVLIKALLKSPSKKQLRAIYYYYFEGNVIKEVGKIMGISECSVFNYIKNGIERCREDLRDEEGLVKACCLS